MKRETLVAMQRILQIAHSQQSIKTFVEERGERMSSDADR